MILPANPFSSQFNRCIELLADLNVISDKANDMAKKEREELASFLANSRRIRQEFRVHVRHGILLNDARTRCYGGHDLYGDAVLSLIDETHYRLQGHILCQAFEAVERFFIGIGGPFHHAKRADNLITTDELTKLLSKMKGITKDSLELYVEYVRRHNRTNSDVIRDELKRFVPVFATEAQPFLDTFDTIAQCRHAIIHDNSTITPERKTKLTTSQEQEISNLLKKSILTEADHIALTRDDVEGYIGKLCDLCFISYKAVSDACKVAPYSPYPYGPISP